MKEHKNERVNFQNVDAERHDFKLNKGALHQIATRQRIVKFEAFTAENSKKYVHVLSNSSFDAEYEYFRCVNGYPVSSRGRLRVMNNWFAIPHASMSLEQEFLLQHGFLISLKKSFSS